MTILVGVKCSDGVVIGADSAVTSAAAVGMNAMTETGASKIELPFGAEPLIVATTGSVGMSLRLYGEIKEHYNPGPQSQNIKRWLNHSAVKFATSLAGVAIKNFTSTYSPIMQNPQIGFGLGALVGYVAEQKPQLVEFDHVQFQPDFKGVADAKGKWRTRPYATMGSGQTMGDPFLAEANNLLFGQDGIPSVKQGRILATWALRHVIKYNTGGIGGEIQLAVIEKVGGKWQAQHIDAGECEQVVGQIEEHVRSFFAPTEGVPQGDVEEFPPGAAVPA
jgi:hypothetical protein